MRAGVAQHRHQGDQRDGGDVLKQQDGEGHAAMRAGQLLAFGQQLQAEGGGGQRQAEPQHHGHGKGLVEAEQRHRADHQSRQQYLGQAHAEHRLAHDPETLGRQFQADDEQQQDYAHLGQVADAFRVANQAEYRGADQYPGQQVAEHCAQLQALGQWYCQYGGAEEYHCALQQAAVVRHANLLFK